LKLFLNITAFLLIAFQIQSQNLTYSPYSRYGLGELNQPTFAHSGGMGGTFIGVRPDTTTPIFINAANPAAIAFTRMTVLDIGGFGQFSEFDNGSTKTKTQTTHFSYGSLGFPIRQRAGACFGLMPYSNVGYNLKTQQDVENIGTVTYKYSGDGGINKAFLGIGVTPFKASLRNFYRSTRDDSLIAHQQYAKYKRIKFFRNMLSDLSIGVRGDYLFGNMSQTSSVIFPNSNYYYNSRRYRAVNVGDFSATFGFQTSFTIDSTRNRRSEDSIHRRREMRHKVKFNIGYYVSLPSVLDAKYSNVVYNYALNAFGDEIPKDTVSKVTDAGGSIQLPLEQGIGISFKKGEMLLIAADLAYTNWSKFRFLDNKNTLSDSYRASVGINFTPDKHSIGADNYIKRIQYRIGASYSNGYLELKNTRIDNYSVTVGLGLPVGLFRSWSMVHVSAQFGKMGSVSNQLVQERYARIIVGFTFNDRWFIKYKYD
jgi:hypothetical protein